MAVSRARSVERSRLVWFSYPLPAALVAWLSNDVPACRGLAGAWLIRGARAPSEIPGIGLARHGRYPRSRTGRRAFPMVAVMIAIHGPRDGRVCAPNCGYAPRSGVR